MKSVFSLAWLSSKSQRKQRKFRYNAPANVRHNMLVAPVSKDLAKKAGVKRITVRKGDTVTITRGQYKKQSGKVARVDYDRLKVFVEGIGRKKVDGSISQYPIDPSNVLVTEMVSDKKRIKGVKKDESPKTNSSA